VAGEYPGAKRQEKVMIKGVLKTAVAVTVWFAASVGQSHADVRQCQLAGDQGHAAVRGYYDPRIAQVDEMSAKGVKITDIKVKVPLANGRDEWLSLAEVKQRLASEESAALREVATAVNECERGFKPYEEMINGFVRVATGGLSELLPQAMTRIDVSDIFAGYPLGGADAFIPKLREQLLGGDRGTVANMVRDPWKCITFQRKC
jgi:hypothetical protein